MVGSADISAHLTLSALLTQLRCSGTGRTSCDRTSWSTVQRHPSTAFNGGAAAVLSKTDAFACGSLGGEGLGGGLGRGPLPFLGLSLPLVAGPGCRPDTADTAVRIAEALMYFSAAFVKRWCSLVYVNAPSTSLR